MKIIIFEGIATSGKSTIIKDLVKALPTNLKIIEADETITHEPIMEQRAELHIDFFTDLIADEFKRRQSIVIRSGECM